MRPITRKAAMIGSTLALALSGIALGSAPASAATTCYAASCTGLDPASTVCQNDATTLLTADTGVELRYSRTCRAVWARMKGTSAGHKYVVRNTNNEERTVTAGSSGGTVYTAMVNDADIYAYAADYRPDGTMASSTLWS
ncbi:DUF2690 domain-containing protein [Kitasatospora sp. NPDC059088]|uniref:DUF2690 domain-containing protein n=1 Tax=unclassified Kitasatospora TaxID=2633591 RepID=UPI0036988BFF